MVNDIYFLCIFESIYKVIIIISITLSAEARRDLSFLEYTDNTNPPLLTKSSSILQTNQIRQQ